MNRNIYYVYVHLDMDGRIFYVGKGRIGGRGRSAVEIKTGLMLRLMDIP